MNTIPYWKERCAIPAVQAFLQADVGYMPRRESESGGMSDIVTKPVATVEQSLQNYIREARQLLGSPSEFLQLFLGDRSSGKIALHASAQMIVFDLDMDDFGDVYKNKIGCPPGSHAHGESMCVNCWRQILVAAQFTRWAFTRYCIEVRGLETAPRYLVCYSGSRGIHIFVHPSSCMHLTATNSVQRSQIYTEMRRDWKSYIGQSSLASLFALRSEAPKNGNRFVDCDTLHYTTDIASQPSWLREWFNGDPRRIWLFNQPDSGKSIDSDQTAPDVDYSSLLFQTGRSLPIDMNLVSTRHCIRVPLSPHLKTGYASTPFDLSGGMEALGRDVPSRTFAIQCEYKPTHYGGKDEDYDTWNREQRRRMNQAEGILMAWCSQPNKPASELVSHF